MIITAQSVEAFAVVASVVMQLFILREMKDASRQMRKATTVSVRSVEIMHDAYSASLKSLELASCPVLTLRLEPSGAYSIQNCGKGPALMAQWAYGKTIVDSKAQQGCRTISFRPMALDRLNWI